MSATSTSASAGPTGGFCHNLYVVPTLDANCAMPFRGNHTDIMSNCCKEANVISYYDDCGIYCLAVGQDVSSLSRCLFDNGAADTEVFCRGNLTETATETGAGSVPETASARIVASGSSSSDSDDEDGGDNNNGNGNSNDDNSNDDDSPAASVQPGLSVLGFTIGALLVSATAFGALTI